jgi:hypothetical protein
VYSDIGVTPRRDAEIVGEAAHRQRGKPFPVGDRDRRPRDLGNGEARAGAALRRVRCAAPEQFHAPDGVAASAVFGCHGNILLGE